MEDKFGVHGRLAGSVVYWHKTSTKQNVSGFPLQSCDIVMSHVTCAIYYNETLILFKLSN